MAEAAGAAPAASAAEHDDKVMVGVSMTPEEKAKLEEFCKLFPKKHLPDTYHKHSLWRFLSARNYDIPAAEKMLREHFEWRVQIEADSALSWTPPTVLTEYLATGWFGKDKSGNLVRYERPGIIDFRGLFRAVRRPDLVKYRSAYMMEDALKKLDEASAAKGSRVSGITFIVDMAGFGPSKIYRPGITFVREIFRLLESNYPQVLEKVFIVNPPGIFPVVFGLVSKFMDERTRRKFTVVKNLDTLREHFDADQLPQVYGGSAKNPDGAEGSPKFSGGMVPPSMYLSSQLSSDNLRTVNIGRFSRVEIPIDILQVKSVIKWEFVTDYDVNFGLYKQTSESNQSLSAMECVIAMKVVQGKGLPEEGGHECEEIGRYVFVLDNSFGLLFSRDVRYNLQVITPDGEITDINTDSTTTTTEPAAATAAAAGEAESS